MRFRRNARGGRAYIENSERAAFLSLAAIRPTHFGLTFSGKNTVFRENNELGDTVFVYSITLSTVK